MADKTLLTLLDRVRAKTLEVLEGLDDVHAKWTPPNLQNSCLWHAGHAYVVTESLTARALGREAQLPEGWFQIFGWESDPAKVPSESWPALDTVIQALTEQHQRLRELFTELTDEQLEAPQANNPSRTARYVIIHGLYDEARHGGEIFLLRKMMDRTFVVVPKPES